MIQTSCVGSYHSHPVLILLQLGDLGRCKEHVFNKDSMVPMVWEGMLHNGMVQVARASGGSFGEDLRGGGDKKRNEYQILV